MRIDEAVAEVLDAIGDEPEYRVARLHLEAAGQLLLDGTTEEARRELSLGLAAVDAACPL